MKHKPVEVLVHWHKLCKLVLEAIDAIYFYIIESIQMRVSKNI
jgi:hypothetical protein